MTVRIRKQLPGSKTMSAARSFNRRTVLKSVAAAGTFAALGPYLLTSEVKAASGVLKILFRSGYVPQSLRDKFEADTGVRVKVTDFGSNEELLNKIKAAKGRGFDLIGPSLNRKPQWKPLGLLQGWDMSRMPTDKVFGSMLRASTDEWSWGGKNHHLPYLWSAEGMSWRTDKWSREYKDLSYGDLWQPEMEGFVQGRPHSMMAGIGLYHDRAGKLPSNRMLDAYKDEANMRRIWGEITKFAVEHKPWIKQFWNDRSSQKSGLDLHRKSGEHQLKQEVFDGTRDQVYGGVQARGGAPGSDQWPATG